MSFSIAAHAPPSPSPSQRLSARRTDDSRNWKRQSDFFGLRGPLGPLLHAAMKIMSMSERGSVALSGRLQLIVYSVNEFQPIVYSSDDVDEYSLNAALKTSYASRSSAFALAASAASGFESSFAIVSRPHSS